MGWKKNMGYVLKRAKISSVKSLRREWNQNGT